LDWPFSFQSLGFQIESSGNTLALALKKLGKAGRARQLKRARA